MMTLRNDLLDHAVDLFPAPEGSVVEVERDVARRQRNRRLATISVVVAIWVVIGVAVLTLRSPDDSVPIQPPPSPTLSPGSVDARGWPTGSKNRAGVYSWYSGSCGDGLESDDCAVGFIHNAYPPGEGDVAIFIDGDAGHIEPHEGAPVTVFGYEGNYLPSAEGFRSLRMEECEEWMVDIQGTTVTIRLCTRPEAPRTEVAEAREVIESIRVEPVDNDLGFRLILTLTTGTWDSG